MKKLEGKICMVTGANSGIGKVTTLELASMGAKIVMVCRDARKGEKVRGKIVERSGNPSIDLLIADLSSQKSIRHLVQDFKRKYDSLHVLVNNASTVFAKRTMTNDGIEATFAINHLGYFLLTNLLLDVLKESAPSRIVIVSSGAHKYGRIDFNDFYGEKNYKTMTAYSKSKLANILFSYELARRLNSTGVTVNCVHPGMSRTNIWQHASNSMMMKMFLRIYSLTFKNAREGAKTVIYLSSAEEVERVSGKYFIDNNMAASSPESYDIAMAEKLWAISEKLVDLKDSEKHV
jgi:NAD(P)-dependent dehydrogenase (short-subunit alcohol dehydrogenase family)